MISGNLTDLKSSDHSIDGRWRGPDGDVLVEVKRTNSIRDIRDGLLTLIYILSEEPLSTTAMLCVATPQSKLSSGTLRSPTRQSRLSPSRLRREIDYFRSVLRGELADRVDLIDVEESASSIKLRSTRTTEFESWLEDVVARETTDIRATRQTVTSALALLWLRGAGPLTIRFLQELCGASYPTVAIAVRNFAQLDLIEQRHDRRVRIKRIPASLWMKIAEQHAAGRKIHRFIDPTGQSKSPATLATKLFDLQQRGLAKEAAVGGVLGARHYFGDLNITASPRLDLSVYGAGDLHFVQRLDAALEETEDSRAKASLIVHVTPEPAQFIDHVDGTWASQLECYADLLEIGLVGEANEMMLELSRKRLSDYP